MKSVKKHAYDVVVAEYMASKYYDYTCAVRQQVILRDFSGLTACLTYL